MNTRPVNKKTYRSAIFLAACFFIFILWLTTPLAKSLDVRIMDAIHGISFPFLTYGLTVFILFGSPEVAVSAFVLLSFWYYRRQDYRQAYLCLAALLAVTATEFILKQTIPHIRPPAQYLGRFPFAINGATVHTSGSFPSGHTMRAALFFGMLILFNGALKNSISICAAIFVSLLTGFSLVYYGFHWLSDVIGGLWLVGIVICVIDRMQAGESSAKGVQSS